MASSIATFDATALADLDKAIARLSAMGQAGLLSAAVRQAAEVMKKQWVTILPPNGIYSKTARGTLKKTMRVKVFSGQVTNRVLAIVNTRRGAGGGNHLHLVELGHEVVSHGKKTGRRTRSPKPAYRDIADAMTRAQRDAILISAAHAELAKLGL